VRASDWVDLPAFDVGDVYAADGSFVEHVPPPTDTASLDAGLGTGYGEASGAVSYFGNLDIPSNAPAELRPFVDAGAVGQWNYFPGLQDEWTGADMSWPNPPRSNGPFSDSLGGATTLGRRTVNEDHWLLLGYNTVAYTKHMANGVLLLPSNHQLALYLDSSVGGLLPPGSDDDSWSWVETNADVQVDPILPSSIDIGLFIQMDDMRYGGIITVYAQWIPLDGGGVDDLWVDEDPGAGWTAVGTMPYSNAAGWASTTIDITGLDIVSEPYLDSDVAYRIALTFRNAPDDWVDPVLGVPADGPHIRDVSWTTTRIMAHYPDGAVKYRFVGPEVIEGGSASYASHVGIVAAGTDPTVYIVGVTNGTITDTVAWPYDGVVPENGDILAVARPDTRIGTRVTFLMKSSAS